MPSVSDVAFARIGTSLAPVLLGAARNALAEAQTASDWVEQLEPSIVAILCAATAVEAAINWAADARGDDWLSQPLPPPARGTNESLAPDKKWAAWMHHRTGQPIDLGQGLGQRIVLLIDDRNLMAHFRGVRGADGKIGFHLPPDEKHDNRSRVRTYFDPSRAEADVRTAEEAIHALG